MAYSVNTFLKPLSQSDRLIQIVDSNGIIKYSINPFTVKNTFVRGNVIYISLNSDREILIDFRNQTESRQAIVILESQLETLRNKTPNYIDRIIEEYIQGIGLSYSNGNLYFSANLIPSINSTFSIGLSGSNWLDLHVASSSIYLGGVKLSTDETNLLINGAGGGSGLISVTYQELNGLLNSSSLEPCSYYLITDFRTCYDQPDFDYNGNSIEGDNYRTSDIHPLIVFSLSESEISQDAYQPDYPKDKIKYDISFTQSEVTSGTAYGRIIERIDEFNNRTDFDHREVKFVRYPFWVWDKNNPFTGTLNITANGATGGMSVEGIDTDFVNSHQTWDVIWVPDFANSPFFITEIISATQMVIESNITDQFNGVYMNNEYYQTYFENNVSFYQSTLNGLTASFEASEHLMFDEVDAFNNYFGDVANLSIYNEETFILPNNVFFDGPYRNNHFGNYCVNNTFDDDCSGNKTGDYFERNIITNDFDDNIIGNNFLQNVITSDFEDNEIGNFFENNYLIGEDFNDNQIGDSFNDNKVWSKGNYDFENNIIGNNFGENEIYTNFDINQIGYSFYNNDIYGDFSGNKIGNDFEYNNIGSFEDAKEFHDNLIGNDMKGNNFEGDVFDNFILNSFTNNDILGDFFSNKIGNYFQGNDIEYNFAYNEIGSQFYDNTIGHDFGFGGGQSYGNKIGNYFNNNTIGEHFYSNRIVDLFNDNITGNYFRFNDIQVQNINGIDFLNGYNYIISFTDNTGASPSIPGTDGFYEGLTVSSGDGYDATFDVTVSSSVVTSVVLNNPGFEYQFLNVLTISHESFGGTAGSDIEITVGSVSATPPVYGDYNCTIFRNSNNLERLSYWDEIDGLTITEISNP